MAELPRPSRLRTLALWALVTNIAIVFTGGLVRVTGSGLGCPTWPTCDGENVIPRPGGDHAGWQTAIEFGNRLMTFVVLAVAVGVTYQAWQRRHQLPRGFLRLAFALPAGVLLQAVVGGLTVLAELSPLLVATHFLLSMVLIALAAALHERARGHDAPPPATGVRWATTALAGVGAVVLVLGTLVTAAGPHAGDPGTPRLALDIRTIAMAHADAVWLLVGLTVALVAVTWRHGPRRLHTALRWLLALELLQGAVGYTQYALGIPEALVAVHILGAALLWTTVVAVWVRARPVPAPEGATAAPAPADDARPVVPR